VAAPPSGTYYLLSASRNGIIAHIPSSANLRQHALFDRSGKRLAAIGAPVETPGWVAWSPDQKRMIWEQQHWRSVDHGAGGGTESRFTFDGRNLTPQWSPDGARVAFASNRGGTTQIYQKPSNQAGQDEQDEVVVHSGSYQVPSDWTRRYIIVRQSSKDTAYDLLAIPMDGEKKPIPLLQTKFNEIEAWFHRTAAGSLTPPTNWGTSRYAFSRSYQGIRKHRAESGRFRWAADAIRTGAATGGSCFTLRVTAK
jgi:Tol biopolymer transport system component